MTPSPKLQWEEQRVKNIEINTDIECAWRLISATAGDSRKAGASIELLWSDVFQRVRALNEETRRQEREKILKEENNDNKY